MTTISQGNAKPSLKNSVVQEPDQRPSSRRVSFGRSSSLSPQSSIILRARQLEARQNESLDTGDDLPPYPSGSVRFSPLPDIIISHDSEDELQDAGKEEGYIGDGLRSESSGAPQSNEKNKFGVSESKTLSERDTKNQDKSFASHNEKIMATKKLGWRSVTESKRFFLYKSGKNSGESTLVSKALKGTKQFLKKNKQKKRNSEDSQSVKEFHSSPNTCKTDEVFL